MALGGLVACAGMASGVTNNLDYEVRWVGNDSIGNPEWVLHNLEAYHVSDEGDQYTNVFWEEGGGNVMRFDRDGKWKGIARRTHGWGYEGGEAIAANSKYVFLALQANDCWPDSLDTWPNKGTLWKGVSRRDRADFTKGVPFESGKGGKGDTAPKAFKVVVEFPEKTTMSLRGLYATETELFVAVREKNIVYVYDTETMKEKRTWAIDRPDRIVMDAEQKTLWVLQAPEDVGGAWASDKYPSRSGILTPADLKVSTWALLACDPQDGKILSRTALDKSIRPTSISIDKKNRLLLCDAGVSQQVLIFEGIKDRKPKQRGTFGEKRGIFGGPVVGKVGEKRFNNLIGAGCDAQGNYYIACNGSTTAGGVVIESYTPNGKFRWRRYGLVFASMFDIDENVTQAPSPVTATQVGAPVLHSVYSTERRFEVDFSKPVGEQMTYAAYTVNPWKYPDDPRAHLWTISTFFTRIQGKPLLFAARVGNEYIHVYRFNPKTDGETAIPAMLYTRNMSFESAKDWPPHRPDGAKTWVWTDLNADGQFQADEFQVLERPHGGIIFAEPDGTIWQVNDKNAIGVPFAAFTPKGIPTWAWDKPIIYERPKELTVLKRFKLDPKRDIALFGGYTAEHKSQHWKPMGAGLCAYAKASTANPELMWSIVLPYEAGSSGHESNEPMSFEVVGDYVFVCYTRGLKADGVRNAFVKVFSLADGSFVGNMASEDKTGEIGLLDIEESMHVRQLKDGTYIVFLEDDYKGKNVIFKWKPKQ